MYINRRKNVSATALRWFASATASIELMHKYIYIYIYIYQRKDI